MNKKNFIVQENDTKRTIYKYLLRMLNTIPKSKLEKLFRNKDIKINGKRISSKTYVLQFNDEIEVFGIFDEDSIENFTRSKQKKQTTKTFDKKLEIIFENLDILIINKPNNLIMHSSKNSLDEQVLNYLNYVKIDSFVPTHIGRLDKETSGLVVYAKNYKTLIELLDKQSDFEKIYTFIPFCNLSEKDVLVTVNISEDEINKKMQISNEGKKSITRIFYDGNSQRYYAQILTGRKHQIRLVLADFLKCPILGERKYANLTKDKRLFLHSYKLTFHNLNEPLEYLNEKVFKAKIPWEAE
ncbi:RluA family pseudouridine synthase [[Mycoplasma] mobile]|nr:RluA family pseudouridine synthase [[Mycoplasma] mobile]